MKKTNIITIIISVVLISCTKVVDVDVPEQAYHRLVVEGGVYHYPKNPFNSYQAIRLRLSRSFQAIEEPKVPEDAIVEVRDLTSGELFLFEESTQEKGLYEHFNMTGKIGHSYQLYIRTRIDDIIQEFESKDQIKARSPMLDTVFIKKINLFTGEGYSIHTSFKQNLSTQEYFYFQTFINGDFIPDVANNPTFINSLFDDRGFGERIDSVQVVDKILDSKDYPNPFEILIKIHSISPKNFDYLKNLLQNDANGNDIPVGEVKTMIYNKTKPNRYALGIFLAASIDSKTLKVKSIH